MDGLRKINDSLFPGAKTYPKLGKGKALALGFQHAFAMSCATILVPLLTGLDVGVALLAAGIGTLIFHLCTGGKNPVFLGSSFAFIAALQAIISRDNAANAFGANTTEQIQVAMWGIIAAGALYLLVSLLIKLFGSRFIDRLFPPVVRGVGITIIGLNLALFSLPIVMAQGDQGVTPLLQVDAYAVFYMGLVLIGALATCTFGRTWLKGYPDNREEFYLLLLIATAGGLVLAASRHLASLFIGIEMLTLPMFGLVGYAYRERHSLEASI